MEHYEMTSLRKKSYDYKYLSKIIDQISHDSVFVERNYYSGQLGAIYNKEATEFKLWAPTASQVELLIYDGYYGGLKKVLLWKRLKMTVSSKRLFKVINTD
ncbi:hypothetical protein ACF3NG_07965 [Aerococcaceae bacterium WGS1372]